LLSSPGQVPVSERVPTAARRSTDAVTTAKIAPWSAAAARTSGQPLPASVALGASSSSAASFQIFLKIALASMPPPMLTSMLSSRYNSLAISLVPSSLTAALPVAAAAFPFRCDYPDYPAANAVPGQGGARHGRC